MWIVKFANNSRHSAWDTRKKALYQVEILKQFGYRGLTPPANFVEYDETVTCEDGHYYV